MKEKYSWKAVIGPYRKLTSAKTTDERIGSVCTDGGVVTSLLIHAMNKHLIQGALVSKKIGAFARQPVLVTQPEELIDAAG
ncbi:coenzyme F420 hydrogenase, partial [bacterium]|nr:coenzyme F420 hydrogenase [bacterium]